MRKQIQNVELCTSQMSALFKKKIMKTLRDLKETMNSI